MEKRFAIPQVNIQELVRLDSDRVRSEIESVHGVPVYRIRGRLLPLVYLGKQLKLAIWARTRTARPADEYCGPSGQRPSLWPGRK